VGLSSFNAFKHLPFKSFPRHKINIYIHINFENTLTFTCYTSDICM